jgi:general nucleoside transport system ATP-binding protein
VDALAVELKGISKRYPGVVANDSVNLTIRRSEVHCLLGENGAGKSTLMGILSGMVAPDTGRILVDGAEVEIASPRNALELGIGMVYQHSRLVPTLSVLENLMLGEGRGFLLDRKRSSARLQEVAEMLDAKIAPHVEAGRLSLGEQQQIEIVKALWHGSRVLILDEPTSMLTPTGVAELQKALVRLKEHGLAIVFITHKLHEALAISDRVSIMRRGRLVGTIDELTVRSTQHDELRRVVLRLMFGDEARAVADVAELKEEQERHAQRRELPDQAFLELADASTEDDPHSPGLHDVTLAARPGEILGVAGVDGNGQQELAEAIAGQRKLMHGDLRLGGVSIKHLGVAARQRLGVRYVTDDRLGEGIVGPLPVGLNFVLRWIGQPPFWRFGRMRRRAVQVKGEELIKRFDVRTPSVDTRVATLSGGNIQKVILARELSFEPKVVVYNKPTHGLDVKTTSAVRQRIREQAEAGVTALIISTDIEELLDLCDRIAVLFGGRLQGTVENMPGAEQRIGELMVGGAVAA